MMKTLLAVFALFLYCGVTVAAQPARFNYQARLTDSSGLPLTGVHNLLFSIYRGGTANSAGSGVLVFQESIAVTADNGVVSHAVGTGSNLFGGVLSPTMFRSDSDFFVQVEVDLGGNIVLPRTRIESVPFAMISADGDTRQPLSGPLPITINQSGSYYLTQNLTASGAIHGITILVDNVILDLNSYTLTGAPSAGDGIVLSATRTGVVIQNGIIRNWPGDGIDGSTSDNCHFRNLLVTGSGGNGILCDDDISVHFCAARSNGLHGFNITGSALISACQANDNGLTGLFSGIHTGNGGKITSCQVGTNAGNGIETGTGSVVSDCGSRFNGRAGYNLGEKSAILGSVAENNVGDGINTADATTIHQCTSSDNGKNGINITNAVSLRNCIARQNLEAGIIAGSYCRIQDNVVDFNTSHGIHVQNACLLEGNSATRNGQSAAVNLAGIFLFGSANRADGNHATGNIGYGIQSTFLIDNYVMRNTAYSNTVAGYSVSVPNTGPTNQSVSTSTSPWANFDE